MESKHNFHNTTIKQAAALVLMLCSLTLSMAQSTGTLSSYSRFGLGLRNEESLDWQRSMGGVGVALPSGNRLNNINPASYAYVDSLTFIFDAGMTAGFGRMEQQTKTKNVKGITLDHIVMGFRLTKNVGVSFGFKPYTTVGYSFTAFTPETFRSKDDYDLIETGSTYSGSGGLSKAFLGIGWKPFGHWSIGMNAGVLWGNIYNYLEQGYTANGTVSSDFDGFNFVHSTDVTSYTLDFGTQYAQRLSPKDWLTIGATIGIGHTLSGTSQLYQYLDNGTGYRTITTKNAYSIPMTYALGLTWHHKNNLLVAGDFHYDAWGNCRTPVVQQTTETELEYPSLKGMYRDNVRLNFGTEWIPNMVSSKFYNRVRYRAGLRWSNAYEYTRSNTSEAGSRLNPSNLGPWELGIDLGFGFPLTNTINYHAGVFSVLNVGFEWMHRESKSYGMVTENYLMVNIGLQFNERWFKKYKIQ